MPAVHSPSGSGQWPDPQQRGHEHRARHDDVAPETSWGYSVGDHRGSGYPASSGYDSYGAGPDFGGHSAHPYFPQGHEDPRGSHGDPRYGSDPSPTWGNADRPEWGPGGSDWAHTTPVGDREGPDGTSETTTGGSPGKTGRNLPAAIAVGVTLGAAVIGSLFVWRPAFVLLAVLAIAVGIWEMARALEPIEARPPLVPLLLGGTAILVLAWFAGLEAMVLGLVLTVVAVLVWRLGEGPVGYQRDIIAATLIAAYVPFLAAFAVLLAKPEQDGAFRVTITLAAAVLSDVGGYAMGVLFGRHPMAPKVSPKKSWEGFAGSLGASAVGGAVMLELMLDRPWWQGMLFGIGVALAATLGDLAESLMKRDLGVKDMGRLLPGHGGLMDRLDSLLFAVPTGYLLLVWFAPPVG